MTASGIFRPGMRTYFIPFAAGVTLAVSAFMPWVIVGETRLSGIPDVPGLWIAGLGGLAAVLAMLSLITRRNSRHPLLLVGLIALAIMVLSWRILPRMVGEQALTRSQASAIVANTPIESAPTAFTGSGIYLGLAASVIIVLFGLTIVVKRVSRPYAIDTADDDVDDV